MRYALEDLLKLRGFKFQAASDELKKHRAVFEEALQTEMRKKKALTTYRAWRVKEENTLFSGFRNKRINIKKLDDFKLNIQFLREKEIDLKRKLSEAADARQEAAEALEEARRAYFAALREKQKIEEHKKAWAEAERKETERLEDKEMEEFRMTRTGFGEDTGHEQDI